MLPIDKIIRVCKKRGEPALRNFLNHAIDVKWVTIAKSDQLHNIVIVWGNCIVP